MSLASPVAIPASAPRRGARAAAVFRWPLRVRVLCLAALLVVALLAAVGVGAVPISPHALVLALSGHADATTMTIVRELRLPRAIQAALIGAALAVSGAVFQALLRNPLAEPYILGVSSGAAAGAVVTVVTGWAVAYVWALPVAAFAGAVLSMLLVFRIALGVGRTLDIRVMLLGGVVVTSFLIAVIWLMLTFADTEAVRSAIFWMMGSDAGASWHSVALLAACLPLPMLVLFALARPLDLLSIGEPTAAYLGIRVERTKLIAFGAAAFLSAISVSVSGSIGFVGLIVPHAIRLLWGADHRALLPCSALAGAAFLAGADTLARTLAGANELPIGIVTALIGVPCFVWLLRRPEAVR